MSLYHQTVQAQETPELTKHPPASPRVSRMPHEANLWLSEVFVVAAGFKGRNFGSFCIMPGLGGYSFTGLSCKELASRIAMLTFMVSPPGRAYCG